MFPIPFSYITREYTGFAVYASIVHMYVCLASRYMYTSDHDFRIENMPINCVVGGCFRNQDNSPESSFFRFPSESSRQRLWVRFVDNTRSDFVRTQNSRVCSAHFVRDDFELFSEIDIKFHVVG